MPEPALRLTPPDDRPGPWDACRWTWSLKHGLLRDLTQAEIKVLLCYVAHADARTGQAHPSVPAIAAATGLKDRAIHAARKTLLEGNDRHEPLMQMLEPGGGRRAMRVALIMPAPDPVGCVGAGPPALHRDAPQPCTPMQGSPASGCRGKHSHGSPPGKQQQGAPGTSAPRTVAPPTLFTSGGRDAAAAEILLGLGMPPKVAHGLVTQHRPTAEQLRNVLANAEARNAAHARGECPSGVANLQGFVVAAIRRAHYQLDDRVLAERRRAQQQRQRAAQAADAAAQADRDRQRAERRAALEAAWERLSPAERETFRGQRIAQAPELARAMLAGKPATAPQFRNWWVEEQLNREGAKSAKDKP